jgi:hypothetical protein
VLRGEDCLLAPGELWAEYVEFAAVFLELRYFAPGLLPRYFPSMEDPDAVAAILAEDVDHASLHAATRPADASAPVDLAEPKRLRGWSELPEPEEVDAPEDVPARSEKKCRRLMARADRARAMGNVVRAAILRVQAEPFAPRRVAARCRAALRDDLNRLERRLATTLELAEGPQPWHEALAVLTRRAARGVWTVEGRLLYDLQKICLDGQRERFAVDLIEWCLSLGRRPIQRPLPARRDVVIAGHLAGAIRRLAGARLSNSQRHDLDEMLWEASGRTESRIRRTLGPRIEAALDDVGLVPQNVPEAAARRKLVEELLDRIVTRGFLTMSDVRDAVSRNQLKLRDLGDRAGSNTTGGDVHAASADADGGKASASWGGRLADLLAGRMRRVAAVAGEFFRGDALLGVNRRLAVALDGVYHRGEIYLRWMQRMVGVAFGTATGRRLTQWVAIPFAGAFVILKAVEHVIEMCIGSDVKLVDAMSMTLLGVLLMAIVNSRLVRGVVRQSWTVVVGWVRWTFVELPRRVLRLPWVRRVLDSRWFRWSWRFGLKPLALSTVLWILLPHSHVGVPMAAMNATATFFLVNLLLNSRVGRMTEEVIVDWALQAWHRFGVRFLTGLFAWTVDLFHGLLRLVERLMYAVDEWFRFRTGENRLTFWVKAVFGTAWFFVTYVVRFCITLLIEPQVNPIKHFPVVTVSHKVLLPFIPYLARVLDQQAFRVGVDIVEGEAVTLATLIITSIPGIFGFFVWELKESWRLFAATRAATLRPAPVIDHGETMGRLLRRGFHSGTLPKRFQKLRRAERKARHHGNWRAVRKHLQALHHVEISLQHFVERELIELLRQYDARFEDVRAGDVRLGPNSVGIRLARGENDEEEIGRLVFEARDGWLAAGFTRGPAVDRLDAAQKAALANALVGLHKAAGVELVHQQIEAWFPKRAFGVDLVQRGLVVWSREDAGGELVFDLHGDAPQIAPEPSDIFGDAPATMPRDGLVFAQREVAWADWIDVWTPSCGGRCPRDTISEATDRKQTSTAEGNAAEPRRDRVARTEGAPVPRRLLPDACVLGSLGDEKPPR